MNAGQLIQQAYTKYRGKTSDKTPAWGSDKANVALEIANSKQSEWALDPYQVWASNFVSDLTLMNQPGTVATTGTTTLTGTGTYFTDFRVGDKITVSGETVRTIDTITSDTVLTVTVAFTNTASGLTFTRRPIVTSDKEYTLHRDLMTPSDKVTVTTTQDFTYNLAKPQARTTSDVYISGRNPKKLTFYKDIDTSIIGGELKVPGYYHPAPLVNETDIIAVDEPVWLVYVVAAELCRNDPAKETQLANLVGMANDVYSRMIVSNEKLGSPEARIVASEVPQVSPALEDTWS